MTVAPTEDGTRWRMRIANDGSAAVAVVADARLLSLSFDRGEKKKPVICSFPASIRTFDLDARTLVMGPGKSYSESFDPRALCFSRAEAAVLAEGGTVTPLLGWAAREKRPSPPYVASGTAEHVVAPEVVLRGPPVSVDRSSIEKLEPVLPQPAAAPTQGPDPLATRLWLTSEPRVDAATSREVPIAVTVKNIGARPATFRFRADTLTFELVNERGTVTSCQSLRRAPPIRELFRTLQPGQSASTMLLLDVACPHRALDEPGLYAVKATLDTRQASGAPVAVRTFDGVVEASNRTLLRIRQPRRATLSEPPTLE